MLCMTHVPKHSLHHPLWPLTPHITHLPPHTQAARRYLTVLATTSLTQAKDGGVGGLLSPLAVMDPWVILQYLTAGLYRPVLPLHRPAGMPCQAFRDATATAFCCQRHALSSCCVAPMCARVPPAEKPACLTACISTLPPQARPRL